MIPRFSSLFMVTYTMFWAVVALLGQLVEPTGRLYMWIARALWGRQVLWLGGVRVDAQLPDDVDWKVPYVVCSNHASQFDIPALFAALPMPVRFLAKKSLFYIPVLGWSMWLARFIPVDRGAGRKARAFIDKAAVKIRKGPSLLVFPEGTRTATGKMGSFKSGAFVLAIKAQVPVLPVAVIGSYACLPKGTLRHTPGTIRVVVGTPIPTTGMTLADRDALKQRVRDAIAALGAPV